MMDASTTSDIIGSINDSWVNQLNGSWPFWEWLIAAFIALILIALLISDESGAFKKIFKEFLPIAYVVIGLTGVALLLFWFKDQIIGALTML